MNLLAIEVALLAVILALQRRKPRA